MVLRPSPTVGPKVKFINRVSILLKRSDHSIGYDYRVVQSGLIHRSGAIRIEPDLVDEARKAAVADGAGSNKEVQTWAPEFIWLPPVAKADTFA
jgi:hypothetical protein